MPKVLAIADLRKVYGDTVAVDGVSFDVGRNEIVGLLGPNGAGKTTIINMILGILEPTAGTIHIEGADIARHRSQALGRTNFTAVYAPLPGNLTVIQNLRFFGLLYGVPELGKRMDEVIRQFDIERFRHTKCGVLSSGEQTRAGLRVRGPGGRRRAVDLAQHARGRADVRPRAVPLARADPARGRPEDPAPQPRQGDARRPVHRGGPRAAEFGRPRPMMRTHRIAAILLRQFYLIRGSPARLLPLFVWAAVDIVLWGFITRYLNTITSAKLNFIPTLLGAVLFWDFFTRVMYGVTTTFLEDVWSRNFLNLFATPLTIAEYLAGLVISSIVTSSIGLITMLILAIVVFGLSFFAYGLALIPFLLVLFFFGIALGVFAIAMVLRYGPAAEWFVWPIPAVLSPFAAVFYPVSALPAWMQRVSRLLPPSYVFESMRTILAGGPVSWSGLLWGLALAALYIFLSGWLFTRIYRHAVRTGLIARYSAETLS
jgi:ABC-2 type transport system permease protein